MKNHNYYYRHQGDLKQRLKAAVDLGLLRDLHRVRAWRHLVVVGRLVFFTVLCGWALWQSSWPWLWALPCWSV